MFQYQRHGLRDVADHLLNGSRLARLQEYHRSRRLIRGPPKRAISLGLEKIMQPRARVADIASPLESSVRCRLHVEAASADRSVPGLDG